MSGREGFRHEAGGGDGKLNIIRYGRDEMTQHELPAAQDGLMPGQALMRTTDGNGDPVFDLHDDTDEKAVYIAVEARGRGMDAQTDSGYSQDDLVIAVLPSGGGLNLRVATGEDLVQGDFLTVETGSTGNFVEGAAGDRIVAHAGEEYDLTGLSNPALVRTEVEQ